MICKIYRKDSNDYSHPFPTATHKLNFEENGYKEEEFFFEGTANVYEEEGKDAKKILHGNVPYCNRFLVRRPEDAYRFSGNIVVEILNATAGFDIDRMWIVGAKELMRNGDIYVGITSKPDVLDSMKKADPERYEPISWQISYDRPARQYESADRIVLPRKADCETGLFWDMLTELAEILRTDKEIIPEEGKRYLYLCGWSQSAAYMFTYLNYFAFSETGESVFDGYLAAGGVHSFVVPLNQNDYGKETDIKRNMVTYMPVPYIAVQTESENAHLGGLEVRQEDSDEDNLMYRIYEIAGATHDTKFSLLDYYRGDQDMERVGCMPEYSTLEDYPNDYPYEYCFYAIYRMLFSWVREGIRPPHGERIAVDADGENKKDALGNAIGGIRTPFLDVPTATYHSYSAIRTASGDIDKQSLFGHTEPFSKDKLERLYKDVSSYRKLVEQSARECMERGFLIPEDVDDCIEEAVRRVKAYVELHFKSGYTRGRKGECDMPDIDQFLI